MAHDWLLGFAAWGAFLAYEPPIRVAVATGSDLIETFENDAALQTAEQFFDSILYDGMLARKLKKYDEIQWPPSVPTLTADRESMLTDDAKAAFDLVCISTAACFLHEFRHVQFADEKDAPPELRDEERECDAFSRNFILGQLTAYSQATGQDEEKVRSKRIMGLATAAFIIGEATPKGETPSDESANAVNRHPPSADRFRELAINAVGSTTPYCWEYVASLLLASLRRENRMPKQIVASSVRDLCEQLVAQL
jgi:hypothetical protein